MKWLCKAVKTRNATSLRLKGFKFRSLQLVYDSRCLYKECNIFRLFSSVHSYFVFVVFVPVSHFSFVRFCIYFFTFHCLLHFFLFYSFPSSLIAVFQVSKSSFVFPLFFSFLILRLSLFLPSFRSLEMPFSISCMSTVFTGSRPEPWGRNDNEDMLSYVGLKHPRGWSRKGPNGVVSFSCAW